jgi:hypothetical protein
LILALWTLGAVGVLVYARLAEAEELPQAPQCRAIEVYSDSAYLTWLRPTVWPEDGVVLELWANGAVGYPAHEIGWNLLLRYTPQANAAIMWTQDRDEYLNGQHAVAVQVYKDGMLVDGWQQHPAACMRMITIP